jgi:DNA polymerase-3 subunit chi
VAEVFFYHLTESTLDEALPALVEKSVARGWRAAVQTGDEVLRDKLDSHLWSYRADSFLPHAIDGGETDDRQPVLLTVSDMNANGAKIRFLVGDAIPPQDLNGYDRVVLMFDGLNEDAVGNARGHWKALKAAGHDLTYWQQGQDGRWEKRA